MRLRDGSLQLLAHGFQRLEKTAMDAQLAKMHEGAIEVGQPIAEVLRAAEANDAIHAIAGHQGASLGLLGLDHLGGPARDLGLRIVSGCGEAG
jgi:hypothetical protein